MIKLTHEDVLSALPDRDINAHKGNFGKVLLLCGSLGYSGAAALASMGALRTGAGLVYLGVPKCIYEIEAIKLTEPIIFPLDDHNGMLSESSLPAIISMLPRMDAVLIGPGLGVSDNTEKIVCEVLRRFDGPVVLDADGINLVKTHKDILLRRTGSTVLTPHEGEFERVFGPIGGNRVEAAVCAANETNSIILLKGANTVITDGKNIYLNSTGNPGLATGGSGDVLSGIIISLIGQKLTPVLAAACGAWIHGAAGDICASEIGQYGMLPTDVLRVIPRLLK